MRILVAALCFSCLAGFTQAQTIPFFEGFDSGDADWAPNSISESLDHVSTGGPQGAGDAYVSTEFNLSTFTSPFGGPVLLRGQTNLGTSGSSNGAYAGDWIAAGVMRASVMVRHDFSQPLDFGARFAHPANSPGASTATQVVEPGTWTELIFPINPATPYFGSGDYSTFSNIGNIQLSVGIPGVTPAELDQLVRFDFDAVSVSTVPEPATWLLLASGIGCCVAIARRARG